LVKLHFKPEVKLDGLDTSILPGFLALCHFMETILGLDTVTVTAALDGTHKVGSLHYVGRALDIRCKPYPPVKVSEVVQAFKKTYDAEYDLIWENPGTPNEHLHLEYDPGNQNHG
jgi:hypothetical protein